MANRVFQSVIYQMKDAIDRVVGVVDETGAVIACSELNLIGEVQEDFVAERMAGRDGFARGGYSYQQFSGAKHNDYAVFVEGADETAAQFAAVLAISMQSIKQYHDEKFDKANFIRQGAGAALRHRRVAGGVHRAGGLGRGHLGLRRGQQPLPRQAEGLCL